jgi:hypothetical protein
MQRWKARTGFWIALFVTIGMFPMLHAYAQSVQSTPFSAAAGTTQLLTSGGANPLNPYNLTGIVLTAANTAGLVTAQLVSGTVNGEATGCTTGRANVSPSVGVPGTNMVAGNPGWVLFGNPVLVVPGSAALCIVATGGTVNGSITYNR